jgi:hypothetical protein
MAENKTQPNDADVTAFLQAVEHPTRRADALALDAVFRRTTGFAPQMWGDAIVGYGRYDYTYKSGRSGSFLATGFSPRKARLSVYIMPGYGNYADLLARLGKHKKGASCLYINKLVDVDLGVLEEIIAAGLRDLDALWPVMPR